jgi:hypothetical protein
VPREGPDDAAVRKVVHMTGMIDITVKVPEERVPEFYALVGSWLSGELEGGEARSGPSTPASEWTNTDDDVPLARIVWNKLSPQAKELFSLLMDNPGSKISGEKLADTLNIPNGKYGIAGVLAWPGRHSAAVNRAVPWEYEPGPVGGSANYWMETDVAELFRKVRRD